MKTKSFIALFLAVVMLFSFTACKDNSEPGKEGVIYAGFDQIFNDDGTRLDNYLSELQSKVDELQAQVNKMKSK